MRPVTATLLLTTFLASAAAHAGDPEASRAGSSRKGSAKLETDVAAKQAAPKRPTEVPKDPDNVRGISPYEEKIARGKELASQKDWGSSAAAFQEAIQLRPEDPRGYLLLAQAKRDADVLEIVERGRTKKGSEVVESKLMFVRAELLERRASLTPTTGSGDLSEMLKTVWDQSLAAWSAYAAYVQTHSRVPNHSATATARRKAIEEREEREKKYALVRAKRDNK